MSNSYLVGKPLGIPIRLHITLLIFLPLSALHIASFIRGPFSLFWALLTAVGIFACIALHELGHSIAGMSRGYKVTDILLLPIGGIAKIQNVNAHHRDELIMAAAGPFVSLLLSLLTHITGNAADLLGLLGLAAVMHILSMVNLALAIFNLLPSFPMDGGRIFRALMTPRMGKIEATRLASRIGAGFSAVMFVWGLLKGSILLMVIAVFVFYAGRAEFQALQTQETFSRQTDPNLNDEITVSPPPYDTPQYKLKKLLSVPLKWFEDLFKGWGE